MAFAFVIMIMLFLSLQIIMILSFMLQRDQKAANTEDAGSQFCDLQGFLSFDFFLCSCVCLPVMFYK